ncbi:phytanoyl-CoA dioxygenase family protein [Tengunoibacter tsumagoiensis]|uniref:Phytanoyl-CoA dioxygenase n=1 Tax=Tengunoibacter tsumagoiensis TaxID=2014871 RepID=A0A402A1U5_9CHLR|nr:phytanoyl-CoA dioxygenase family protein [Tengunoibacter tsumagoiensis]GCE13036.1 hypothetical protein KTT_28950 [Tengunoibacter tsumagoiensis]
MLEQRQVANINEALAELGVTSDTLSQEEKRQLDEQGYLLFPELIDGVLLEQLRAKYEELMEKEGQSAGLEVHQEQGTRRLSDLVNKGEIFDYVYTHPRVLAAIFHIIGGEFKLSSLNARDAIPGEGHQVLHADWGHLAADEPFHVANSLWMVDDFTRDNGATRVVPGTHHLRQTPQEALADPAAAHPEQVLAIAPAGTVLVFNSHLWHGGTRNTTQKTRRALHSYYVARDFPQQLDQSQYIRLKTYRRISPAARYLLDVD